MKQSSERHPRTFLFGGIAFFSGSLSAVVNHCQWLIEKKRSAYVCVTSLHGVTEAQHDRAVERAHACAQLIVPDGTPIVWVGRMKGHPQTERIYGPDLLHALCRMAEGTHTPVFFYGTTERVLERLMRVVQRAYPTLRMAGRYAPPFRKLTQSEMRAVIHIIRASQARIVFVGLGTPKQELWMHEATHHLPGTLLIGVGAAFDFISGAKPQAPAWIQKVGGEWLYRLFHEPGRLWRRYVSISFAFPKLIFHEIVRDIIPKRRANV
jgi:N-acetylglucosaminyldiphosphoundecaprenol N-acetyl-beta-D-mannosaminyltransferase